MRYIGNKTKIADKIMDLIVKKANNSRVIVDLFSGSGAIASKFASKFTVYGNDLLYFSKCVTTLYTMVKKSELKDFLLNMNNLEGRAGFITRNYSPFEGNERMYFSVENAKKIDAAMMYILETNLDQRVKEALIGVVVESVSRVANITGVYGAFLKKWDSRALKSIFFDYDEKEILTRNRNVVHNDDAVELIKNIEGDILYLDPPYTKNDYSIQYHLLETIAKYDEPEIVGITGTRRNKQISAFTKQVDAEVMFEKIIFNAKQKYIFVSYSSDGLMSKEFITSVLKRHSANGKVQVHEISHRNYTNHRSAAKDTLKEFVFYIEKSEKAIFSSPMNYMGNKTELIDDIRKNLPKNINRAFDVFGGGMNVLLNINAMNHTYNDNNPFVASLIKLFVNTNPKDLIFSIEKLIKKYGLSKKNKDSYSKIRRDLNKIEDMDMTMLYTTILYSFNQQIRFNSRMEYNNTCGESSWNESVREKLISFHEKANSINISIMNEDYSDVLKLATSGDFVYLDPPYLITTAAYNDGKRGFNGWDVKQEEKLLQELVGLNKKGIKFMLSNVLEHNGKTNDLLKSWIKENDFRLIELKDKKRSEVLVVNYGK